MKTLFNKCLKFYFMNANIFEGKGKHFMALKELKKLCYVAVKIMGALKQFPTHEQPAAPVGFNFFIYDEA